MIPKQNKWKKSVVSSMISWNNLLFVNDISKWVAKECTDFDVF